MNNERILSYELSQELTVKDLEAVTATGHSCHYSGGVSHQGSWDGNVDVTYDY